MEQRLVLLRLSSRCEHLGLVRLLVVDTEQLPRSQEERSEKYMLYSISSLGMAERLSTKRYERASLESWPLAVSSHATLQFHRHQLGRHHGERMVRKEIGCGGNV